MEEARRQKIDCFWKQWPNISSITLKYGFSDSERLLIEKFGKNLVCLRIGIPYHLGEFPAYCPQLRHLYLGAVDGKTHFYLCLV